MKKPLGMKSDEEGKSGLAVETPGFLPIKNSTLTTGTSGARRRKRREEEERRGGRRDYALVAIAS